MKRVMKTADKVALRWASFQTNSKKQDESEGRVLYEISVHLGDLTNYTEELDREAQYYADSPLDDDNLHEAFEELFFSQQNKKALNAKLHDSVRRLTDFELTAWIEDYSGIPEKVSDLKNVTLTFVVGVAFQPPYTLTGEIEKGLVNALKGIMK